MESLVVVFIGVPQDPTGEDLIGPLNFFLYQNKHKNEPLTSENSIQIIPYQF